MQIHEHILYNIKENPCNPTALVNKYKAAGFLS